MNNLFNREKILVGTTSKAEYHDAVLPRHLGNPFVEALPPRRTQAEVRALFETGTPLYDPAVRTKDALHRRQLVDTLFEVFIPSTRHMRAEEAVMDSIRNSYSYRNPIAKGYMADQVDTAEKLNFESDAFDEPMLGAPSIIGSAGTGKTRTLKRALFRGCPQLIDHSDYKGEILGMRQVTWIYVACAHDGSVKDLCCSVARVLDTILGTDYERLVESRRTEHAMGRELARVTAFHATGLIVIDEVQNICVGRPVERRRLARFITKLMESMATRIMLVGTPEAQIEVANDMPLLRRTVGESGQINWGHIIEYTEWKKFLSGIWRYQYTRTETELSEPLLNKMWSLTLGIPDIAVKLYRMAQMEVIGHPDFEAESITAEVLDHVMVSRMPYVHRCLTSMLLSHEAVAHWNKPKVQQLVMNLDKPAQPEVTTSQAFTETPASSEPVIAEGLPLRKFDLAELVPGHA